MTFQQKNSSVTLASFMLILIFFILRITQLIRADSFNNAHVVRLWLTVVVLAIFATIAALILTHGASAAWEAIRTGNSNVEIDDMVDERDQRIDMRGTLATYRVSSLGSFIAMLTFAFGQPPLIMFSLLIFFGVSAQIVGDALRLWLYQQG